MSWPETVPHALARFERGSITLLGQPGHPDGLRLDAATVRAEAERVAGGLRAAGAAPGDRVLLVLPTSRDLVRAFLGCLVAGAIPCLLSPPEGFASGKVFDGRLAAVLEVIEPWGVLAAEDVLERLEGHVGERPLLTPEGLPAASAPAGSGPGPDDLAFLQLTSGTTGLPRAVEVTHGAVAVNARQIGVDTAMSADSVIVSWLPLFHDMGLMAVLAAVFHDLTLVLSTPPGFLCDPASWLRSIDRFRATHSPAPTFAYRHLVRRVRDEELEGLDLSCWTSAFVGAERIHPEVLRAFEERLRPVGLRETALLPCYGMAEATLAITHKPAGTRWATATVGRALLASEGRVAPAQDEADRLEVVSCGRPLPPTTVRILDEDGAPLPEGRVGEVAVRGPSLFRGYRRTPAPSLQDGELRTGDLGFLQDGELYVTGRRKETIVLKGENHHPEEVEHAAGTVSGVRGGRAAAFGVPSPEDGTERLCLLVERDRRAAVDPFDAEVAIRRAVHAASGLTVDAIRWTRSVPVTTSGKIQRARARDLFLELEAAG